MNDCCRDTSLDISPAWPKQSIYSPSGEWVHPSRPLFHDSFLAIFFTRLGTIQMLVAIGLLFIYTPGVVSQQPTNNNLQFTVWIQPCTRCG